MSDDLRSKIEALQRWDGNGWGGLDPVPEGRYVELDEVLALLPAKPAPPAVCPSCKRVLAVNKAQGATTFCVDPWHE